MAPDDDSGDVAQAKTVLSSSDLSLDVTLPSGEFAKVDLTRETRDTQPGAAAEEEPAIARGTSIGRYLVLDPLGSGTMGVVVSAIDPTLDRKVALKLVRAQHTGSTVGRQRLLREAQAMARLQHPNVVTVFEVGTYGDRVFLAMEYVAGATLAAWLAEPKRTQRELLAAFAAAGQGLAAAHRAGIVHRDFKPANVLVARDGRVRVADFGLATAPGGRSTSQPPIEVAAPGPIDMTSTGAVLGTPAYMAPEQHRGQPADARADQFAFCAALYEALYRELPFAGEGYVEYAESVLAGRAREPSRAGVPARIRRVLLRGLALEPAARYATMDALLADLARDPAVARRRAAAIAAGVLGAGALVFALHGGAADSPDACAAAAQPLATLWDGAAHHAMQHAFAASGAPAPEAAFAHAAHVLDARAGALRDARHEACVATEVRHEQSPALLDRRMACIDRLARETSELVGVLSAQPDAKMVAKAVEAVASLPPVAQCADKAALLAAVPPPASLAARAAAAALDHAIDRAKALEAAGRYPDALAAISKVLPAADRLGYGPVRVRAHELEAKLRLELGQAEQAVRAMRETGALAAAAHDDAALARAWIGLYHVTGYVQAKTERAKALEPLVAAAVVRAGGGPELRGDLDDAHGTVALAAGDYRAAATHFTTAARELEQAFGPESPKVAIALGNAGTALEDAGRYAEAQAALKRALAIHVELEGPEHPSVAVGHYRLGSLLDTMGQPEQALAEFQQSAAIDAKVLPPDDPAQGDNYLSEGVVLDELGRAKEALEDQQRAIALFRRAPGDNGRRIIVGLLDLATTYQRLGANPDALRAFQEALDLAKQTYGPDHPEVAQILNNMGVAVYTSGDAPRARAMWQQALAMRVAKLGPDHPDVAKTLGLLAQDASDHGDHAGVVRYLGRAVAILDKVDGPKNPLLYMMLDMLGRSQLALHHTAQAVADLARARDGYLEHHMDEQAAGARLALAGALWSQGRDGRAKAAAEARAALAAFQAQPKPDPDEVASARKWLAAHHVR